jgi:hypothetical protein
MCDLGARSILGKIAITLREKRGTKFALRNLLFWRNRSVTRWRLKSILAADDDPMALIWRGRFNGIARAENGEGGRGKSEREQEAEGGGAFHSCQALCASTVPVLPSRQYFLLESN